MRSRGRIAEQQQQSEVMRPKFAEDIKMFLVAVWCSQSIYFILSFLFFIFKGLIFQTEVEPEEKFFQGGLEKFWKQVSAWSLFSYSWQWQMTESLLSHSSVYDVTKCVFEVTKCVEMTNNIWTSLTNQVNNQRRMYHLLTFHNSLDSVDDFRSGCRNIS